MADQRLLKLLNSQLPASTVFSTELASFDVPAGSITNSELASDAVTNVKVASNAAIALSKLAAVTDGYVVVGSAANVPTAVAMSGDVTIVNSGATTVGSIDLETATVTNIADTEVLIGTGAGTAAFAALSGDVTMDNTGAVTIAAGAVTHTKIGLASAGGVNTGAVFFKFIGGATILPLLNTSTNNLVSMAAEEIVVDVIFTNIVAAGTACTVTIGADINYDGTGDVDGFLAAIDANTTNTYRMTTLDVASQPAYVNGLIPNAAGALTITSSADVSATGWDGGAIIMYVKFQ